MNIGMNQTILKMLYKKNYFICFFLLISHAYGQTTKKLFFSSVKDNKAHAKLFAETKMDSMIIFYQNEFVIGDALKFDKKKLAESIKNRIPKINQKGYAILDWEGNANQILYGIKKVSDTEYNAVRNNYIESIQSAKKLRPNIKWGFYNYPFLDFGKVSKGHDAFVRKKIMPILKKIDFLAPSIYILVDERTGTSDTFAYSYAQSNAEYVIKLGVELNKPVFPFIWHRYGSPNKNYGLIEFSHFENFIKSISDANYLEKKIDGIIWWECEDYVFNSRKTYKSVEKEYSNITNKENHIDIIYRNYYKIINTILNK
jgi:hypothetical protein